MTSDLWGMFSKQIKSNDIAVGLICGIVRQKKNAFNFKYAHFFSQTLNFEI